MKTKSKTYWIVTTCNYKVSTHLFKNKSKALLFKKNAPGSWNRTLVKLRVSQ
jgi:hypothetical protein